MATIDDAIRAENDALESAMNALQPQIEGNQDLARLNLGAEALTEVRAVLALVQSRANSISRARGALVSALAALQELRDSGHPNPINRAVAPAVLAELRANRSTIDAALGQYRGPDLASSLNVSVRIEPA